MKKQHLQSCYYKSYLPCRLTRLRNIKNISARKMSMALGKNVNYINNIEKGGCLPSFSAFLNICQYLDITPSEFFDDCNPNPYKLKQIMQNVEKLDDEALTSIAILAKRLSYK